ncbi:MAG: putative ABC transporter ATP-binding protein YbhF [candidate division BRC1 bacterium ADurb.BinA364]|nr:MAG: putative ABC transporter ATP-binding protein YbhF [candidate division BRC1 bacterium ADurb.BinA364]
MASLEIRSLTKRYGEIVGVENLSLSIEPGEVFGYLGPNGAGKTTTIRCVLGLIRPTAGEIVALGRRVEPGRAVEHRRIGYLPGDFRAWPGLTARQALELLAALGGDPEQSARRRAELAERLELALERRIGELSKGNRQKVGVIAAFQHNPELLILDEPTSGLDPLVRQTVWEIVRESAEHGAAVLFSSHDLTEVAAACERAAILSQGRLAALGPISDIVHRGERHIKAWFGAESADEAPPPNARIVQREADSIHLAYTGAADEVVKWLARRPVDRLSTPEASLEEAFVRLLRGAPEPIAVPPGLPGGTAQRAPGPPFPWALLRFWTTRLALGWGLVAQAIFAFQIALCGLLHDNQAIEAWLSFLDVLPPFIKSMVGGQALKPGRIANLLAIGYQHPMVLTLFMVFAVGAPTGLLPGETRAGAMELLLSRAVTKTQAFVCAAIPTLAAMAGLTLAMYLGTVAGTKLFPFEKPAPLGALFRMAANGGLLAAAVGGISLLAAAAFRQRTTAVAVCVGYLTLNYFAFLFSIWWNAMKPLRPWTLFAYADEALRPDSAGWPLADMAVLAVALGAALLAGWAVWRRRDLDA